MTMWAWHCVSTLTAPCTPRSWAEMGEYLAILALSFAAILGFWAGLYWLLERS